MKGSLEVWTGIYKVHNTLSHPGLLVSFWILVEKRNDEKEDNDDHDEVKEGVEMRLGKEGT